MDSIQKILLFSPNYQIPHRLTHGQIGILKIILFPKSSTRFQQIESTQDICLYKCPLDLKLNDLHVIQQLDELHELFPPY